MKRAKKENMRWNTMKILAIGFMGVIFFGGFLLWLPVCNTSPIAFSDALFTSTSAVCVTGLVTVTPATQFTLFGKIILLILIQIGGLGVIACMTAFFLILKRKISVKEQIVIQETYNMETPGGMSKLMQKVLKGTIFVEVAGALCYAFQFVPEYGYVKGMWYSVFHSVSAFCNAGIDILGGSSLQKYVENPIVNITTMFLIVLGGLGFIVWFDILDNGRKVLKRRSPKSWFFTRLSLHAKVVIVLTAFFLAAGAVNFFLLEYNNPGTLGELSLGGKILASSFQSVTTRTAGFITVPQTELHTESQLVSCILMLIGGSPGGTAGGVKTTTIGLMIISCLSVVRGGSDAECFGRKVPDENIRMGAAIMTLALITLLTGTVLVTSFEPDALFIHVLYETTSAVGTVGVSANLTGSLGLDSQIVIMVLMYIGRIGPMSLALLFGGKRRAKDRIRTLPEQRVLVG